MEYIRPPLKGFPIRYKSIKGKLYAYQRIHAYRDKATGKVHVTDRHLGAVKPARPKPMLDQLDKTDIDIITKAWQRGEDVDWIQMYVKTILKDEPAPATIYNWFRAHGIKRKAKPSVKRIKAADARIERLKRIKAEDKARKAKQARHRKKTRASMTNFLFL